MTTEEEMVLSALQSTPTAQVVSLVTGLSVAEVALVAIAIRKELA